MIILIYKDTVNDKEYHLKVDPILCAVSAASHYPNLLGRDVRDFSLSLSPTQITALEAYLRTKSIYLLPQIVHCLVSHFNYEDAFATMVREI